MILQNQLQFGGGVSLDLIEGIKTGEIEKKHLIINRILRQKAEEIGVKYIDMGTDYHYPFYHRYEPTQKALKALCFYSQESLHYPSSYGLVSLRESFRNFMLETFHISLDLHNEIMINTGASQLFDALSRAFRGKYVLLPEFSLPTVGTIAKSNGAKLLRIPTNENDFFDLERAEVILQCLTEKSIRFIYLNSPCNPTGQVATFKELEQLVQFALKHGILILHDMDSWYTKHSPKKRLVNILEIPNAKKCSITVLSLSKEFGLPGIRVGLIAGNNEIINVIRTHNSVFSVMIPEVCQYAAQAALDNFKPDYQKLEINNYINSNLKYSIEGWKSLGWSEKTIKFPDGGFKYLISVPPNIKSQGEFYPVELFDYYVASRIYVKLSNSRSFNPDNPSYIRMIIMQSKKIINEAFLRMKRLGINYEMELPDLGKEYSLFIRKNIKSDF